MKHEKYRELLALRLYDELTSFEVSSLEEHMALCNDCRVFGDELKGTLGPLKAAAEAERLEALPGDWNERLRRLTETSHERRPLRRLVPFAAGLAAGLLLMWGLASDPAAPAVESQETSVASNAGEGPSFNARSSPPPRATSRSPLSRLPFMLRR